MNIRKIISCILAISTCLIVSVSSYAYSSKDTAITSSDFNTGDISSQYVLVSEDEYIDENGFRIVDRIYTSNNTNARSASVSGTEYYKTAKEVSNPDGITMFILWVSGTFSWNSDNDTATVKDPKGWYENNMSSDSPVKIIDTELKYGSNQGATVLNGLFGNKYAYVEYSLTSQNQYGTQKTYTLYLDVNRLGEVKVVK